MIKIIMPALAICFFGMQSFASSITCYSADPSRSILISEEKKAIEFIDNEGSASVDIASSSSKLIETIPSVMQKIYSIGQYNLVVEFQMGSSQGKANMINMETGDLRMVYPSCTLTSTK